MAAPRHCFVFVCQAGEIEIKAMLLAASLRRFLRGDYELVAAVPTPAQTWGELSAPARQLLHALDVRIEPIVNPIGAEYPIGNKLACLDVPTRAGRIVFLDSDILCLRDFGHALRFAVPFAAKPADLRTFAASSDAWQPLYAAAGVAMPSLRLPTTVSGEFGLPYFNSGVIFVDANAGFGGAWRECALAIRAALAAQQQSHWLDQVALAIAVHKLRWNYLSLDERYNFPAHLKPLPDDPPFLCHYHWPRIVQREPDLLALVQDLAREHPAIAQRIAEEAEWAPLLQLQPVPHARTAAAAPAHAAAIIVAEIPGSGADELIASLRQRGGVVVRKASVLRLDAVRQASPHARVMVCVRDPFAAIAQWKRTGCVPAIMATIESAASTLPDAEMDNFRAITARTDPAEQRAALWWWLAQRVAKQADAVEIVRQPVGDRGGLDADDLQAIRAICMQAAADLGVAGSASMSGRETLC